MRFPWLFGRPAGADRGRAAQPSGGRQEGLALWLGAGAALPIERGASYRTAEGIEGEVRGYRAGERIRVTRGATTVQVTVSPAAGGTKAGLRFQEEHLSSAEERERRRAHGKGVLDEVARRLG
ncbi:SRPBCC domain-containing protein [Streptomyces sp. NPDC096205]|uniref:SRPBCC domain-containing protein n=1 Tax=Streptomyces sp. NPDC096205 TaxID=3366081 RepID=UPI0037FBAC20